MLKKEAESELIKTKIVLNYARQELKDKNKEIERLTELCNKYEEEHKTTFEIWQKDIKENEQQKQEIERLNNIINTGLDKLNTQLAFTSSYQLNYQSAMSIIEETKSILQGVDKE